MHVSPCNTPTQRSYSNGKYKPTERFLNLTMVTGRSQHEQDSYVVLWDKRRLAKATEILLDLATIYKDEVMKHIHGDKVCAAAHGLQMMTWKRAC